MANTNSPFGFRSFGHMDGSAPTMGLQRYFINSSDTNLYFTGDPVALSSAVGGGNIQPYNGSSLSVICLGVFAGCEYYNSNVQRQVWSPYFPGNVGSSSPCTAYVITDPDMQFLVQASSGPITSSYIGYNVNIISAQSSLGNTTNGISNVTIASSEGTLGGSSQPFRVIDVYSNFAPPGAPGADVASAYNWVVVAPNNWARKTLTAVST